MDQPTDNAAREVRRRRAEVATLRDQVRLLTDELRTAEARLEFVREAEGLTVSNAAITPREKRSGRREATAIAMLSDVHIGESIEQEKVIGKNSYNLEIARLRMTRFFEGLVWLVKANQRDFAIHDVLVGVLGDIITGYIHEELMESSLCSPTMGVVFAREVISSGLAYMLRELPDVEVTLVCKHGNHGRTTAKKHINTGAENSFEHLLYLMLAREWANEKRIRWHVTKAEHSYVEIYGDWTRWMHGDGVKYDKGIGGIMVPINRALARLDSVRRCRVTFMGHFHQLTPGRRCMVNGSVCGYNPFAMASTLEYEDPAQCFVLWDSKRGPCITAPIWVDSDEERKLWR